LTFKAQNNQIVVVEDFNFETPKTKEFVTFAKNLKLADQKLLLVLANHNDNVFLSARNLQNARIATAAELNTYRVLNNKTLVLTESSVDVVNKF
jgi:large subunit ribosomal protein L4